MSREIEIPYNFRPRSYQLGLFSALDRGIKRAFCVWHRRAGKDLSLLNLMLKKMTERVGVYHYYFPTSTLGRKVIWEGVDGNGNGFLDYIPRELLDGDVRNRDMSFSLINGSFFQLIGTDRLDVVGTNPVGSVFSEFAKQNPKGWDYVRPILAENGGWAIFNTTPRGKNHAYDLFERVKKLDNWYTSLLTVDDTNAISADAIEEERLSGMSESMIQQEFYCSFEHGIEGQVYGEQMKRMYSDDRVGDYYYDTSYPVYTFWDLGVSDAIAIWFVQFPRDDKIVLIDHYEESGIGLVDAIDEVYSRKYVYGGHYAPWDIKKREQFTGTSTIEQAEDYGMNFERIPKTNDLDSDIELCRRVFSRVRVNEEKCGHGLDCLENYHYEVVEKKSKNGHTYFREKPEHDWTSHSCDAFRAMARAVELDLIDIGVHRRSRRRKLQQMAETERSLYGSGDGNIMQRG